MRTLLIVGALLGSSVLYIACAKKKETGFRLVSTKVTLSEEVQKRINESIPSLVKAELKHDAMCGYITADQNNDNYLRFVIKKNGTCPEFTKEGFNLKLVKTESSYKILFGKEIAKKVAAVNQGREHLLSPLADVQIGLISTSSDKNNTNHEVATLCTGSYIRTCSFESTPDIQRIAPNAWITLPTRGELDRIISEEEARISKEASTKNVAPEQKKEPSTPKQSAPNQGDASTLSPEKQKALLDALQKYRK